MSVIATSDDEYAKNLADSFETAARLQGIRIHASSRFSSTASSDVLDNKLQLVRVDIVEPRCCETLCSEVLGTTNDIFFASVIIKYITKNLDITKPRYNERVLTVPWPFVVDVAIHKISFLLAFKKKLS